MSDASNEPKNYPVQTPNGEADKKWTVAEGVVAVGVASFHKSLPHNVYGEVDPKEFTKFRDIARSDTDDFEGVAPGKAVGLTPALEAAFASLTAAPLVSPQSGRSREGLGPDPRSLAMLPAPRYDGPSVVAEMTELFWMALLRDVSFDAFAGNKDVEAATTELGPLFTEAAADKEDAGRLTAPTDFAEVGVTPQTLFRCGLPGEDKGPLVSQFFLHDARYGTQLIVQKQFPYLTGKNYLTTHHDWLRAQQFGRDFGGDPYPDANDPSEPDEVLEGGDANPVFRRISTMRDLARFVHKDALHQAYFNAALNLLSWGAKTDPLNPYNGYERQAGFATLGGPHLLALVSEVASRALKVVWRQKWQVHLRQRPEAYGGLMQMQKEGYQGVTRAYGLPHEVFKTEAAKRVFARYGTYFLPMAFTSGSPVHPAYGAGHATVAGACVTVLKAWFQGNQPMYELFHTPTTRHPRTGQRLRIVQPSVSEVHRDVNKNAVSDGTGGYELPDYEGDDVKEMTVGGELNKIACNVAMGRSMGGVHWRSDNTRSLRLGEQIAHVILQKLVDEVAEAGVGFSYTSFDGPVVTIQKT